MAEFAIDIAQTKVVAGYTTAPVLSATALDIRVAKQIGQYTHVHTLAGTNPLLASDSGTRVLASSLPYIAGSSLTMNKRYLIGIGGSIGSGDPDAQAGVEIWFISGLQSGSPSEVVYAHNWAECLAHGVPESMRGSSISKWFWYTHTGSDLRFVIRNVQGEIQNPAGVMISGAIIVAIPMEEAGFTYGSGEDWLSQRGDLTEGVPGLSTASTTYATAQVLSYTAPASGDYLLIATAECKIPVNQIARARVLVDGVQSKGEWIKQSADSRDIHSFSYVGIVSLSAATHTFHIEGASHLGGGIKVFSRCNITIVRLTGRFSNFAGVITNPSPVTATYPSWETIGPTVAYTPQTTGEYVLLFGNGVVYRPADAASSLMRIYNVTDGNYLQEFSSSAHPFSVTQEQPVLTTFGAELKNTSTTYALQVTGESGFTDLPTFSGSWPLEFIPIVMSKVTGGQAITIDGTETVGIGESSGAPVPGAILDGTDTAVVAETGILTVNPPPTGIPAGHPRMWIAGNDRLQYWQAQYAGNTAEWQYLINPITLQYYAFSSAMAYKASGQVSYLNAALAQVDGYIASNPIGGLPGDSSWQNARQFCRDMALTYDWLYTELGPTRRKWIEDELMAVIYVLFHDNHDEIALSIYNNGGGNTNVAPEGAQVGHNFFNTYFFACMYSMVALHPNPTTFLWPPVTGSPIEFSLPWNYGGAPPVGGKAFYSDMLEFVQDRLELLALPFWDNYLEGGNWPEGTAYGIGSLMYNAEFFAMLKSAGVDYFSHTFLKDMVYFQLYGEQPRNEVMITLGEAAGSFTYQPVNSYNRHLMLALADGLPQGSDEQKYVQWWLDNVFLRPTTSNPTRSEWTLDFLMYRGDRASQNYTTVLPTHYLAVGTGFFTSRSGWENTATCVSMTGGECIFNNEDHDKGGLFIFRHNGTSGSRLDGWVLCDVVVFQSGVELWQSHYHNTYVLFEPTNAPDTGVPYPIGWSQRLTDFSPQIYPNIARYVGTLSYAYGKADVGSAYWRTRLKVYPQAEEATLSAQVNDIFQREVFHIKASNIVVVYDRFRVLSAYALTGTIAQARWNYRNAPVYLGGGIYQADLAGSRLFRRTVLSSAGMTRTLVGINEFTTPLFREEMNLQLDSAHGGYGKLLNVFESVADTQAAMTPIQIHVETGLLMEGTTIKGATYHHVMFSTAQDGATPATISYAVLKQNASDKHYVCNLVPGQEYFITEATFPSLGGYFLYTLTPTFNTGFIANAGGVVEFTPGEIAGQGAVPIRGDETILTPDETGTVEYGAVIVEPGEAIGITEVGNVQLANTIVEILETELITIAEEATYGQSAAGAESVAVVETGTLEHVSTTAPPTTYVEKVISPLILPLLPNVDAGYNFVTVEPGSSPRYAVLSDDDDGTFVRFDFFVPFAQLSVGLTAPAGYVSRVTSIRFHARVRFANVSGSVDPVIVMDIINTLFVPTKVYTQFNLQLFSIDEGDVQELVSPFIPVTILPSDFSVMRLRLQPRAISYGSFILEVSKAWVEVVGDPSEKVI